MYYFLVCIILLYCESGKLCEHLVLKKLYYMVAYYHILTVHALLLDEGSCKVKFVTLFLNVFVTGP
jgi:hypothetical protein